MGDSKLGSGDRFKALKEKIQKKGYSATAAAATAASIGRKKYGKKRFQELATKSKASK